MDWHGFAPLNMRAWPARVREIEAEKQAKRRRAARSALSRAMRDAGALQERMIAMLMEHGMFCALSTNHPSHGPVFEQDGAAHFTSIFTSEHF